MKIEEIKHIADITMLEFSEEELDHFADSFRDVMEFIDEIKNFDSCAAKPRFQVNDLENHLREDEIGPSLTQEEAVANAKTEKYGYFEILKFVD